MLRIKVNEQERSFACGSTLTDVRRAIKPDSDIIVYNGHPTRESLPVRENDEVVLIKRGEVPSPAELEALMVARHTPGVHNRLKRGCVGIAGLGGLGSCAAISLARVGVGTLIMADFDVVEPSNLNRQQYFVDQIGMPKVDALAATLGRVNPFVTTITHQVTLDPDNIPVIFGSADIIVEAFDAAEAKAMLVETVSNALPGVNVVAASGIAGIGDGNAIRTVRFAPHVFIVGDLVTAARPGTGLMAPRVGIAANHQANIVVRLLVGEEDEGIDMGDRRER